MKRVALGILISLITQQPAVAQWGTSPTGAVTYASDYSTTGGFRCTTLPLPAPYLVGSCDYLGAGAIRLSSGEATLTLSFTGFASSVTATNVEQSVLLGTLTATAGGSGPFAFPVLAVPHYYELFGFGIGLTSASLGSSRSWVTSFMRSGDTEIQGAGDQTQAGFEWFLGSPPGDPQRYTLVYDHFTNPAFTYASGTQELRATVGLVPEPSALALLATGLIGIVGMCVRRRA